ncbi:replication initiation protein, partial [Enterococcus faecium]|uniref:replication initiation protein n=1 Tax=Enterococcus faecium TaxID=1352 RepID=UPI000A664EF1
MSNDIVRYNNGLNSVPLRKFTPIDMDLFWGICSKMKRKGTKEEIFTFKQIKELIDYNINARDDRFANDLIKMSKKIITLSFIYEDEKTSKRTIKFGHLLLNSKNRTIYIPERMFVWEKQNRKSRRKNVVWNKRQSRMERLRKNKKS